MKDLQSRRNLLPLLSRSFHTILLFSKDSLSLKGVAAAVRLLAALDGLAVLVPGGSVWVDTQGG